MKIVEKFFYKLPAILREKIFYFHFFCHPIIKIHELKNLKKLYKKNPISNAKIIYRALQKLVLKTNDGYTFSNLFYNTNFRVIQEQNFSNEGVILICLVKNDLKRIQTFYNYYKELGIENFIFIDNDSTDGTFSFLQSLKDICLFQITDQYSTMKRQVWISKIMHLYGYNRWYLILDSDEFLTYNNMEEKNIKSLVDYATANRIYRMKSLMIDMYSKKPFLSKENNSSFFIDEYRYFDVDTYEVAKHNKFELIQGGVRKRIFNVYRNINPFLIKYPLVFWQEGDIQYNSHFSFPFYKNFKLPLHLSLLHYKFLPDDLEKIKVRVEEKNYASGSKEYDAYLKAYLSNKSLTLYGEHSAKYVDSNSIYKIKLLSKLDFKNDRRDG